MKITLGFSPCPNDTFIFDAIVNKKIDVDDLDFDVVLEDVQTLNEWANEGKLDITKLSFPSLFKNVHTYSILNSGSALGKGVGPLLIAKQTMQESDFANNSIAIPGLDTTANFLLSFAYPLAKNKIPLLFSTIENAVLHGEVDMGVIIHENRFTYQKKGLVKICDLGEIWEERQKAPIPLGCIAAKKTLPVHVVEKIDHLIKQSVEFAFNNLPQIPSYVAQHSQEMDEDVMHKHIDLYVNDFTQELGEEGRSAIEKFYASYNEITKNVSLHAQSLFF